MLNLKKAVLLLVCLMLTANAANAQRASQGSGLPSQKSLDRYGLKLAWWGQATMSPTRDRVRHITLDEQIVVVQSTAGTVTAFDHDNGKQLWTVQLGRRDHSSYPAAINDELVVIPVGMRIYAVDKFKGRVIWQIHLPGHPSTSPTMDNERLYIGSLSGTIYAYNLKKVREIYEGGHGEKWTFLSLDWQYQAGSRISSPPLSNGDSLAFASNDGMLYSIEALDRNLRFQFEPDYSISAPIGFSEGSLYVVSEGYKVYKIDSDNGNISWEFIVGLPIHQAPQIVDDQLFLLADNGTLFCLSKQSRQQLWLRENVGQFLAATSSVLYAADKTGNVMLLSRSDGSTFGMLPLKNYSVRPENNRTDRLFLSTNTGRILCIHEYGRDYPLYHKFPERRPILPEFTPEESAADDAAAELGEN